MTTLHLRTSLCKVYITLSFCKGAHNIARVVYVQPCIMHMAARLHVMVAKLLSNSKTISHSKSYNYLQGYSCKT